jgi:hypothetical protein
MALFMQSRGSPEALEDFTLIARPLRRENPDMAVETQDEHRLMWSQQTERRDTEQ